MPSSSPFCSRIIIWGEAVIRRSASPNSHCAKTVTSPQLSMTSEIYVTSLPIPKHILRQKYLENRLSMRAIASEFSCSKAYVRSLLLRYKIPPQKQPGCHRMIDGSPTASVGAVARPLHYQSREPSLPAKKMYAEGTSTAVISRCLDTMKIPTKSAGEGLASSHDCANSQARGVCRRKYKLRRRQHCQTDHKGTDKNPVL